MDPSSELNIVPKAKRQYQQIPSAGQLLDFPGCGRSFAAGAALLRPQQRIIQADGENACVLCKFVFAQPSFEVIFLFSLHLGD